MTATSNSSKNGFIDRLRGLGSYIIGGSRSSSEEPSTSNGIRSIANESMRQLPVTGGFVSSGAGSRGLRVTRGERSALTSAGMSVLQTRPAECTPSAPPATYASQGTRVSTSTAVPSSNVSSTACRLRVLIDPVTHQCLGVIPIEDEEEGSTGGSTASGVARAEPYNPAYRTNEDPIELAPVVASACYAEDTSCVTTSVYSGYLTEEEIETLDCCPMSYVISILDRHFPNRTTEFLRSNPDVKKRCLDLCLEITKIKGRAWECFPEMFWSDFEGAMALCLADDSSSILAKHIKEPLKSNLSFWKQLLNKNPCTMRFAPSEVFCDEVCYNIGLNGVTEDKRAKLREIRMKFFQDRIQKEREARVVL